MAVLGTLHSVSTGDICRGTLYQHKNTCIHLFRCHVGVMRVFVAVDGRNDSAALLGPEVMHSDRLLHQAHTIRM